MKSKRIFFMLLVAAVSVFTALSVFADEIGTLLISPKPEEQKISFTDVPEDAAYKDAVYKLVENGVLNGYPDGTFRPAGNLTRAELCKMINLSMGYTDTTGAAGFPDLVDTEWYMPHVLAAQNAGYIIGDDTGIFRPNDNITRQEVCAILCRVIKPFDLGFEVTITDTVDDWAKDHVKLIVQNGLMPLEDGDTFRATEHIKRFELAVALAPFSQKVDEVKCTVTYNVDGVFTTEQVVIGKTNPNPLVLTTAPEGYKHIGWALDPKELVPIDTATYLYLEDVTLYPVYEKLTYSVTFMAETIIADTQTVGHGEFATLPNAPSKKGYTFKGWAPEKDGKTVDVTKYAIKADTTFTAVFASLDGGGGGFGGGDPVITTYTVKFMVDGEQVSSQNVNSGEYATAPDNPSKTGFEFLYWSLKENGDKVDVESHKITKKTTFYAVFKINNTNPNDQAIIDALEKAIPQFKAIRLPDTNQRAIREIIVNTVQSVYDDAVAGIYIDKAYVKSVKEYSDAIDDVQDIVDNEMTDSDISQFISLVRNNVDKDTFNILVDYFIDEKTQEKYLK